MTPDEFKSARERYTYIPARLVAVSDDGTAKLTWKALKLDVDVPPNWGTGSSKIRKKYSSLKLDEFHHKLLNSERDEDLMHGLLSVVFWGFASGTDGRVHGTFALANVALSCKEEKQRLRKRPNRSSDTSERLANYWRGFVSPRRSTKLRRSSFWECLLLLKC